MAIDKKAEFVLYYNIDNNTERKDGYLKKFLTFAAAVLLCIAFSGCNVLETDTEALMQPPVLTEEQEKLNTALKEVVGDSYVLKYPKTGDINSAFIFKDLDNDGNEEAMAFYSLSDESTRINVLKSDGENWVSVYEAAGFYGNIESIDFANIDEKGCAIVIKWDSEVGVYRYENERLKTIHSDSCAGIDISDVNGDGFSEIVLIDNGLMSKSTLRIVYSDGENAAVTDDISIHADYNEIYSKKSGKLFNGKTVYFIDSEIYDGVYLTEMFALENGEAKRYFIADFVEYEDDSNEKDEQGVIVVVGGDYGKRGIFLRNTKIYCMDTNGDGITEMPVEYREDYAKDESDKIFFVQYMQYNGTETKVVWNGVANTENGYLFKLPQNWNDKVTVKFGSSADEMVFIENESGRVLYEIYTVSKNDYQDKYEEYVFAAEDKSKNYYIRSFVDMQSEFYLNPTNYTESFIFI